MDLPSVVSGESHAPSEVEFDVESFLVLNPDIHNTLPQNIYAELIPEKKNCSCINK